MRADPVSGAVYVFRAKRADRIRLIFWDGTGLCLFATTCIHTTPPSASVEGFGTISVLRAAARRQDDSIGCIDCVAGSR
ncbi:IS66 family insertion sequence element accessory protein TnpB [Bradyrhizobium sp. ma5]|uniref:IS66 family insertion sequence element accessory protein TnpB n=1 Tax=Bradyrhizobium sp. ma5 TaxID=3344828 RepID=UPI0035D4A118